MRANAAHNIFHDFEDDKASGDNRDNSDENVAWQEDKFKEFSYEWDEENGCHDT